MRRAKNTGFVACLPLGPVQKKSHILKNAGWGYFTLKFAFVQVLIAVVGIGLRAFTALCSFALLSLARASRGTAASDWAAGCS